MEKELFSWEDCDINDIGDFMFYRVTTVKQIADIPAGTSFQVARVTFEQGNLEFRDNEGTVLHSFKLRLEVAPS